MGRHRYSKFHLSKRNNDRLIFIFLYLAIRHGFEPLLLVPIAFGMLLSNLPVTGMFIEHFEVTSSDQLSDAGILTIFYVLKPIIPSLIFLGVGSMTDFGPLIANPKSLLMGAAAQLGYILRVLCSHWCIGLQRSGSSIHRYYRRR